MVSSRVLATLAVLLSALPGAAAGDDVGPDQERFFETQVRPLLVAHCYECHGPKKQESDIRLDTRAIVLEGRGPLVVPGQPDSSRLIEVVRRGGDVKMPPEDELPHEAIAVLETWIKMGAPWPEGTAAASTTRSEEIAAAA